MLKKFVKLNLISLFLVTCFLVITPKQVFAAQVVRKPKISRIKRNIKVAVPALEKVKAIEPAQQADIIPDMTKPADVISQQVAWNNGNIYNSTEEVNDAGVNENIIQMSKNAWDKKLVYVNLSKQQLTALEDGEIKYQIPITSGRNKFPTIEGEFQIWQKQYKKILKAPSPEYGNYELAVDYWMPFYKGYGLHDAPWRSKYGPQVNFGAEGSHGCVNISPKNAKWIFNWTNVGTSVFISK